MLGVDHVDLDAASERAHRERRQQVGLAGARMPEHRRCWRWHTGADRTDRRITGVPGGTAATDDEAARLLEISASSHGRNVASALVSRTRLRCSRSAAPGQRRDVAVEHSEGAWLQPAEGRASRRLDSLGARVELAPGRRHQRQVDRDVERLLLARGQPALQVFRGRQSARQRRVGGSRRCPSACGSLACTRAGAAGSRRSMPSGSGTACQESLTRKPGGSNRNSQPGSSSVPGSRSTYQVRSSRVRAERGSRARCRRARLAWPVGARPARRCRAARTRGGPHVPRR